MLMNSSRRQQLLQVAEQQSNLPSLYLKPYSQDQANQKQVLMQNKESDFIKRIKRAKSIMIAHKNRKQKNVLNSYFMDSTRKRKANSTAIKKCSSIMISNPKPKSPQIVANIQKFQNYLFPPVHSSMQICLNINKKMKSRQMRVQPLLYGSVDIGKYLIQQMKIKTNKKQVNIQLPTSLQKSKSLKQNQKINSLIHQIKDKLYDNELPNELKISSQDLKMKTKLYRPQHFATSLKRRNERYGKSITQQHFQQGKMTECQKIGRWQYSQPQQYNQQLQTTKF